MAKKTKSDLPSRTVLLRHARSIPIPRSAWNSEVVSQLQAKRSALYDKLLNNREYKSLCRKVEAARRAADARYERAKESKAKLIRRIELEGVTAELTELVTKAYGKQ